MRSRLPLALALLAASASVRTARAETVALDRVVVRFYAPETGGPASPRFVFERELAFEARLEALADPERGETNAPYLDRHVRAALERHVSEELLSQLPMDPEPTPAEVARRAESARDVLEQRVGGRDKLIAAAAAEGIDSGELDTVLRREARASLYLDRMVAPMLDPSDAELRELQRSGATPFRGRKFEDVLVPLRKWYVAQRLSAALATYYQNARSRVQMTFVPR
jgi:hypothetical protein